METRNFEWALVNLKNGYQLYREGWNGKGMWIQVQYPDLNSMNTKPYIFIQYPQNHMAYPDSMRVPWVASQTDLFAEDWNIKEE